MPQRLPVFDILRSIATLAVIGIHISASYVLVTSAGYAVNQLTRFAVPMFLIISGYLLCHADLHGSSPLATGQFFKRRFAKILWPYVLWSLFYVLLQGWADHAVWASLYRLPGHLLSGGACYHLYFVVIILQMYLLYPPLKYFLHKNAPALIITSLVLTMGMQTLLYLSTLGRITLPPYNQLFLVYFPTWIFFFVLGMTAALQSDAWDRGWLDHPVQLGSICLLSAGLLMADSIYTGVYYSSSRPTIIFYAVSCYFFFYSCFRRLTTTHPWINWFSQQSFLIYLMHPFFISVLTMVSIKINHPRLWSGTSGMILFYLAVLAITVFSPAC
jgi:surface polysaccharide O-acyltransferase-like enzyme